MLAWGSDRTRTLMAWRVRGAAIRRFVASKPINVRSEAMAVSLYGEAASSGRLSAP